MPRPSHPSFYTRDDREAPLLSSAGRGELVEMICPTGIAEFFCEKDWTAQISLNPQAKLTFTRTRFSQDRPAMPPFDPVRTSRRNSSDHVGLARAAAVPPCSAGT